MIDGLKIVVSSAELKEHLAARAAFHKEKAAFYHEQIAKLRDQGERGKWVTNDPVMSLENSEKNHENKAGFFGFMAEHVVPNEDYWLSESELARLELVDKYL